MTFWQFVKYLFTAPTWGEMQAAEFDRFVEKLA